MFGFVMADTRELTPEQLTRYNQVYCGVCRNIRNSCSPSARMGLSFDCAFLALLLMSLYEPEETVGKRACSLHPIRPRPWTENEFTRYAADMNVALAYYNAVDDWYDDHNVGAKAAAAVLEPHLKSIRDRYPRQCQAIEDCICRLAELEQRNCDNPDEPANCFGELMGQLFVYREDLWQEDLFGMGMALGRFVYLTDAAVDYSRDVRKKKYNPFAAMGVDDSARWEEYLVLAMARCTTEFEKLPLVQDKAILDNILYSGVWVNFGRKKKEQEEAK